MNKTILKNLFRGLVVLTVAAALSACGNSNPNNNTNGAGSTTGGTTGGTTGAPTGTTGTTTGTTGSTTGTTADSAINLYTSFCDPSKTTCPDNRSPYQTKVALDQWLPNGWEFIANVDTGTYGNIIIQVPHGKYRLRPAPPTSGTATTTAATQTVTTAAGQTLEVDMTFGPVN